MEKTLKNQLKKYSKIFIDAQEKGKKEADLVMYLVQFFQEALGYDIFKEISKEYQIKGKYCDVAIKIKGQVELLVEAKQPGVRLADRHIEQAEIYAMKSGTRWVLLTNGLDWRLFHLRYDEVDGIESSLVFKTDLVKNFHDKPDDVIEKFLLLQRRNFLKGDLDKYFKKKTMLIPISLGKALFTEDVLRAIGRVVNRGAEVRVGIDDIAKALRNMLDKEVLADMADIKIIRKKKKKPVQKKEKQIIKGQKIDFSGTKPVKVRLFKESINVKTWRDVITTTSEILIKKNRKAFNQLADSELMKGGKRVYLSKNENAVYFPRKLNNGLFIDVNLSANTIVRVINKMLTGCGYKESDLKIILKG